MKLLTKELQKKLPPLYAQDGKGKEAIAYAKFFDPCSSWTWYATEYDPEDKLFFGLAGTQDKELGYFSLTELERFTNILGLGIERDLHFEPTKLSKLSV